MEKRRDGARSASSACLFLFVLFLHLGFATQVRAEPFAYVAAGPTVSVINTATNQVTATIPLETPTISFGNASAVEVAITPDGNKVYVTNNFGPTASDASVFVISTDTNQVIKTIALGPSASGLAITPDGSKVYVAHGLGTVAETVSVLNTTTDSVITSVTVGNNPRGVAITPDGAKAYVVNFITGTVSVIDALTNILTATVTVENLPLAVAVSPDGTKVYVTNSSSQTISVIDTSTSAVIGTVSGLSGNPRGIAITPDGAKAYVATLDSTVSVIDLLGNTLARTIPVGSAPWGVAVTPDGSRAYVTNIGSDDVTVIDTSSDGVMTTVPGLSLPKGIAISGAAAPEPATPVLSVSTTFLDFGSLEVGESKNLTFEVTNVGDSGSLLSGTATTSSPSFKMVTGTSFDLTTGASQTVFVKFEPTSAGSFIGTVSVDSNGGNATVNLAGIGTVTTLPPPQIFSLSLDSGQPGDLVTITGTNFDPSSGKIFFGTASAGTISHTETQAVAIVPNIPPGTYPVTVETPYGTSNSISFTITDLRPYVLTQNASPIGSTSAHLNGLINPNGSLTTGWFEWGQTASYGLTTVEQTVGAGNSSVSITQEIDDLSPNTTYHVRAVGQNSAGVSYGVDETFTTSPAPPPPATPPTATTGTCQVVGSDAAQLFGTVNPNGSATTAWFQWSLTTAYGQQTTATAIGDGTSVVQVLHDITDLTLGATYHFRMVGQNSAGTGYGVDLTCRTDPPAITKPTVTTDAATTVTSASATLNGTINPNGAATTGWFEWGLDTNYGNTTPSLSGGSGTSPVPMSQSLTGLSADTSYHFRAVGQNSAGTTYGGDRSFTTSGSTGTKPTVNNVSPNPVPGSDRPQAFTIYGTNFDQAATVTLRDLSTGEPPFEDRLVSDRSSTHLVINPNFTFAPADWTVEVINSDGLSSGQFPFSVVAPDLIVENVTFSPRSATVGDTILVSFRIRNVGDGAAGETEARMRLSQDQTLTRHDPPLNPLDVDIPALPAGDFYNFNGTVTIPNATPAESYYVGVFADWDNRANQSDISNDDKISSAQLSVSGSGVPPPVIISQPQDMTFTVGDQVPLLTVQVEGEGPFRYVWRRDGHEIRIKDTTETSDSVNLGTISSYQAGTYIAEVSNSGGVTETSPALLTVNPSPDSTPPPIPLLTGQLSGQVDSSRPTIVITHGWQPFGVYHGQPPEWVETMRLEILKRFNRIPGTNDAPNVLSFAWPGAFTREYIDNPPIAFGFAWASAFAEGLTLARELQNAFGESYSKGIHFIGHSLGTFVNAEAVSRLPGFNHIQFTSLENPLRGLIPGTDKIFRKRLQAPQVQWVDNYIGTTAYPPPFVSGGRFTRVGDLINGAAWNGGFFVPEEPGKPADHAGVHEFYLRTITEEETNTALGGFHFSRTLGTEGEYDDRPRPRFWDSIIRPGGTLAHLPEAVAETVVEAGRKNWRIVKGSLDQVRSGVASVRGRLQSVIRFGTLLPPATGQSDASYMASSPRLLAPGAISIGVDLTIPARTSTLRFDLQVPQPGDGDSLTIFFNDSPLYSFVGESFFGDDFQQVEFPIEYLAGQTGVLTVTLNSTGDPNVEFVVSNFQFFAASSPTDTVMAGFESPGAGPVAGVAVIRGWAFAKEAGEQISSVELFIDGASQGSIPCCSERGDIETAFPDYPATNTLNSGWGRTFNWGLLSAGDHTVRVEITASTGEVFSAETQTVTVVKPGDFEFLDQFSLAASTANIESDELVIKGVLVRDKATQQEKEIDARFRWSTGSQSLELISAETKATMASLRTLMSELWASVETHLIGWGFLTNAQAASGVQAAFESPGSNQVAGGVGIARGWAFTEDTTAAVAGVRLMVDGQPNSSIPCCSERMDVATAFPDNPNASSSGWGLVLNYGVLTAGPHTIGVEIEDSLGGSYSFTHDVTVVKLGGFEFLDIFDLSAATAQIGGEEIVLEGVLIQDQLSQQTKVVDVRFRWLQGTQGIRIVSVEE